MEIVDLIVLLVKWFVEAAIQYNGTDEGATALADIENRLEALGIDVPGFTPTDQGQPLDMSAVRPVDGDAEALRARLFRERHPELFEQEGKE